MLFVWNRVCVCVCWRIKLVCMVACVWDCHEMLNGNCARRIYFRSEIDLWNNSKMKGPQGSFNFFPALNWLFTSRLFIFCSPTCSTIYNMEFCTHDILFPFRIAMLYWRLWMAFVRMIRSWNVFTIVFLLLCCIWHENKTIWSLLKSFAM